MTRLDSEQDEKLAAEAAKNSNRLENVLMKNRTLTLSVSYTHLTLPTTPYV